MAHALMFAGGFAIGALFIMAAVLRWMDDDER